MNRIIKFRCWDKENKAMNYFIPLFNSESGGVSWIGGKLIPMQFTGLLDKNGKEIYEGDIVALPRRRWCVTWDTDRWGLYNGKEPYDNGDHYYGYDITWKDALLLGNIYENPELLPSVSP